MVSLKPADGERFLRKGHSLLRERKHAVWALLPRHRLPRALWSVLPVPCFQVPDAAPAWDQRAHVGGQQVVETGKGR